ncbi:MAG TPA: hypothetical protein PK611_01885 [Saprospiraceae bacterium]|nr:hypothetical protein [Saprospiraceae bacterium]HRO07710.1 hypothetical protein [Saprospiraceae bacterium]HRO72400.1 hypothetical protein [Saprospiraceae bacterium]HRP41065.1 hypothetical protein [Saprospiraceae bacterium]
MYLLSRNFWSWFLLISLYLTALYSHPVFKSVNTGNNTKDTIDQACLPVANAALNNTKSFLSNFKRPGSLPNAFLNLQDIKSIYTEFSCSLDQHRESATVFVAKVLRTLRIRYHLFPYHHHW